MKVNSKQLRGEGRPSVIMRKLALFVTFLICILIRVFVLRIFPVFILLCFFIGLLVANRSSVFRRLGFGVITKSVQNWLNELIVSFLNFFFNLINFYSFGDVIRLSSLKFYTFSYVFFVNWWTRSVSGLKIILEDLFLPFPRLFRFIRSLILNL